METGMNEGNDDFRGPPEKDPLQTFNVIMIILGWTVITALSAYIILG
jgi:hypothetical protein